MWLTDDPNPSAQAWGQRHDTYMTVREFYVLFGVPILPGETDLELLIALERSGRIPARLVDDLKATGRAKVRMVDKTEVRITVEIPDADAHRYSKWRQRQGVSNALYRALADTGGDPSRWWIVERAIPSSEWTEAVDAAELRELVTPKAVRRKR